MSGAVLARGILVAAVVAALGIASPAMAQDATAAEISVEIDGDYGPHMPPAVYAHDYARKGDLLIEILHYFMLLLFVGWGIFFVYCLFRFRQRPGHQAISVPIKGKVSKWLEIGICVFEGALLIGLSIPVWAEVKNQLPTEEDNPMRVRVVAEQFAWNFHYSGPDGVFGKAAPQHIDMATNILGIDPDDPNGQDDLTSGELHFPVGRKVIAEITSKDVIHSFSVQVLRVKQDAIPGMRIPVWFEAAKAGNYEVACAQLCGNNHYSMKALMAIHETQAEFDSWFETAYEEANAEFDEDELD